MILIRLLILASILTGCAARNIPDTFDLKDNPGTGVVAGSITYEGGYASYRLQLVSTTSGEKYRIQHANSQTLNLVLAFKGEPPHAGLGERGSPFAIPLPAGTYKVTGWQISQGAANVWSTVPVDIQFDVQSGKAIYLGNFHFRETSRFARAITGATLSLRDFSERDIPVLQATFPALKGNPVTQSVSKGTNIENVGGKSSGTITLPIFVPVFR